MSKLHTVMIRVVVTEPPEGAKASDSELRVALENVVADIGAFDVEADENEDGVEVWTVDDATVTGVDD